MDIDYEINKENMMETAAVLHNIRTIKNSDMAESLASQLS